MLDHTLDDRINVFGLMVLEPALQVEARLAETRQFQGVTAEVVRDEAEEAIVREVVGDQLAVGEDAKHVGQDHDGLGGGLVAFGVDDIGIDCSVVRSGLRSATVKQRGKL